jgi:tetratricopeptide (TPR) repeat protein
MDPKILYREGVIAIRDQKDLERGRELLLQAVQLDPNNDMAWLWLTRTVKDLPTRLQYLDRALQINPQNEQARTVKERLLGGSAAAADSPADSTAVPARPLSKPAASASPSDLPGRAASKPAAGAALPARPPSNPASAAAVALPGRQTTRKAVPAPSPVTGIQPLGPKTVDNPINKQEKDRIAQLMDKAEIYLEAGDAEQAIAQWVDVLQIRVDHELALRNAAGHLCRLNYWDDARELVNRAIDAGTKIPTIYLTALDLAERQNDFSAADALRQRIATLSDVDEQLFVVVADSYLRRYQNDQAVGFLQQVLAVNPTRQKVLIKLGDILQEMERKDEALKYYDQAVRLGARSKEGKAADKKLAAYVPVLTDRERGSTGLAVREAAGFILFYLLLAWQDAGLNLLNLGPARWGGVLLSWFGGYLLITATSSPQQQPLAARLGGSVQPPKPEEDKPKLLMGRAMDDPTDLPMLSDEVRWALGMIGVAVLLFAAFLVFHTSLDRLMTDPLPYLTP